jgi:3-carboxy-cis,cis-muconate cycloisomerase
MAQGFSGTFDLLSELYGNRKIDEIFSETATVKSWLNVESALAQSQADLGIIPRETADAITRICEAEGFVDSGALWETARVVGYPILGLVRQIDAALEPEHQGRVHLGATTQDIMDSGLAQQLARAGAHLQSDLLAFGNALAVLVDEHRQSVMPGRTHGQQAVPITLGAKLAIYLSELLRHHERLQIAVTDAARVSLFGAAGTSAALGPQAASIRTLVAERLGLSDATVPWHVARDSVIHLAHVVAGIATTCARLAREVMDLSRTELAELRETQGHHRGASSTMPQKSNPITSESILGFSITAVAAANGLDRAAEVPHERASGEWQAEWSLIPMLFRNAGSALSLSVGLARGVTADTSRMKQNLTADGGLVMSEAAMIQLTPELGRERAHDVIYELAVDARHQQTTLASVLSGWAASQPAFENTELRIEPHQYLGDTELTCTAALNDWAMISGLSPSDDRKKL